MGDLPNVLLLGGALVFLEYLIVSVLLFLRRPLLASGLILATLVLETAFIALPSVPVGINLFIADLIFIPVVLAACARVVLTQSAPVQRLVPIVMVVVFALSYARGAATFGIIDTAVEARGMFYFLAGAVYFATFTLNAMDHDRLVNQWLLACTALMTIALYRWVATLTDLPVAQPWKEFAGASGGYFRVLQAAPALTLAVGLLLSLHLNLGGSGALWHRKLIYALAPVVLILQHRTVWVVCLAGVAWLFVSHPSYRRQLVGFTAAASVVALSLVLLTSGSLTGGLISALESSSTDSRTFDWRVEGWGQLVSSDRGYSMMDRLIGQPFGSGYSRIVGGFETEVSPHSFYVRTLMRLGIAGMALLVLAYVIALKAVRKPDRTDGQGAGSVATVWGVALIAQLVYSITYDPPYDQGIILGIAIGASALASTTRPNAAAAPKGTAWQPIR